MLTSWRRSSKLLVLKDIPNNQSPLLTKTERIAAAELVEACKNAGFILIAGQALAKWQTQQTAVNRQLLTWLKDVEK
jgi:isopenicillin N synthase-like dioxygenase